MMKFDDLENALRRVPRREPPPEWRAQILHGAQATTIRSPHSSRFTQRSSDVRPSSWQWNWNWAWSGLAASWLVIVGVRTLTPGASDAPEWTRNTAAHETTAIARTNVRETDNDTAWREQRRLLAQLLQETDALPVPAESKRRTPTRLGPRSDRSDDGLGQHDSLNLKLPTATV